MSVQQKTVAIVILSLGLVTAGAYFLVVRAPDGVVSPPSGQANTTSDNAAGTASKTVDTGTEANQTGLSNTQVGDVVDGWKTMKNADCGLTYRIPADWAVSGYLGESKIVSPENERQNAEWAKSHQDLLAKDNGDVPPGPDARTLYISCQYDVKTYLGTFSSSGQYKEFADNSTLVDAFASGAFTGEKANPAVVRSMKIGGHVAYEIRYTVSVPGIGPKTTYEFVAEIEGKVYEIQLGDVEYDKLPDAAKRVIDSITFAQ